MAVVTVVTAGDVSGVFADRCDAVMTRTASPDNLSVVDRKSRNPRVWCMAIFADNAGKNVVRILARRIGTVVAARAVACDVDVVKVRRQPACCRMAVAAVVAAGDMRWGFSCCDDTVVAGAASTYYLCVVYRVSGYPDIGVMAVFADIGCQNVCQVLAGRFNAIVATGAFTSDTDVIEIRG